MPDLKVGDIPETYYKRETVYPAIALCVHADFSDFRKAYSLTLTTHESESDGYK